MARSRRPPRPGALADLSPLRILTQILLLQASYYVSAAILLSFTALTAGKPISLDLLLSWHTLRGDVTEGWMWALVWMLNGAVTAVPILLLIARSKLVLDFALTIHLLHLIFTTWYSRAIPRNFFWWGLQVASSGVVVSLGMWSCQWRELRPIMFGGNGKKKGGGVGDVEGGRGAYEMVSTKDTG